VAAQADISDVAAVARMFDSAETAFGGVDVLINNAGRCGDLTWRR
jgi:3-oxoacyl-[acyl-carrier protein] reductase